MNRKVSREAVIKMLRDHPEMTQAAVAATIGCSDSYVSQIAHDYIQGSRQSKRIMARNLLILDPEVVAVNTILTAIQSLDPIAKERVLNYVHQRLTGEKLT